MDKKNIEKGNPYHFLSDDYIIGKTFAESEFGKMKLGKSLHTQESIIVEIYEKSLMVEELDKVNLINKINIIQKLNHPKIIQTYEWRESETHYFIISEFNDSGDLLSYINSKIHFEEEEAGIYFGELISAVEYLHSNGVVHRDIKLEKMLLDKKRRMKLSDFSGSKIYSNKELLSTPLGTVEYAPPEVIKLEKYDPLLRDIWSCGVCLYVMVCGYFPFGDSILDERFNKLYFPDFLSSEITDLFNKILDFDLKSRINLDKVKLHPWFKKYCHKHYQSIQTDIKLDENVLNHLKKNEAEISIIREDVSKKNCNSNTAIYHLMKKKIEKDNEALALIKIADEQNEIDNENLGNIKDCSLNRELLSESFTSSPHKNIVNPEIDFNHFDCHDYFRKTSDSEYKNKQDFQEHQGYLRATSSDIFDITLETIKSKFKNEESIPEHLNLNFEDFKINEAKVLSYRKSIFKPKNLAQKNGKLKNVEFNLKNEKKNSNKKKNTCKELYNVTDYKNPLKIEEKETKTKKIKKIASKSVHHSDSKKNSSPLKLVTKPNSSKKSKLKLVKNQISGNEDTTFFEKKIQFNLEKHTQITQITGTDTVNDSLKNLILREQFHNQNNYHPCGPFYDLKFFFAYSESKVHESLRATFNRLRIDFTVHKNKYTCVLALSNINFTMTIEKISDELTYLRYFKKLGNVYNVEFINKIINETKKEISKI